MKNFGTTSNPQGGRTTISPPSNVQETAKKGPKAYQVLAHGIDKLVLAIDIEWKSTALFNELEKAKSEALENQCEIPFTMPLIGNDEQDWKSNLKPHGSQGYEWLLIGKDFSFKIGRWIKPISRPSVMVEIHSETLWRLGPENAVETIIRLLTAYGAQILVIKASRVDLCLDSLLPQNEWNSGLLDLSVTRASYAAIHKDLQRKKLQGISIGKGGISARLYDKALEIEQKSKKEWMYNIWGIKNKSIPFEIIRVEFQLRREVLKELGVNSPDDLFRLLSNLWAYCSKKWLSLRYDPDKHPTRRKIIEWWRVVHLGFTSFHEHMPLIRCKAFGADEKQIFNQAYGMITSLKALALEKLPDAESRNLTLFSALVELLNLSKTYGKDNIEFNADISRKRAKYQRLKDKIFALSFLRADFRMA